MIHIRTEIVNPGLLVQPRVHVIVGAIAPVFLQRPV